MNNKTKLQVALYCKASIFHIWPGETFINFSQMGLFSLKLYRNLENYYVHSNNFSQFCIKQQNAQQIYAREKLMLNSSKIGVDKVKKKCMWCFCKLKVNFTYNTNFWHKGS